MTHSHRYIVLLIVLSALLLFVACPKQPVRLSMVMSAAPNVNPDVSGQPLSVVVRIYQLKDKGRLESADYNALMKSDKDTLAEDLLERQERVVQPGSQQTLDISANPAANYVGVVALFRSPSGETWRKIIPLGGKTQKVTISLHEQVVDVTATGK
jgi:type VI secretion system protein VasD